MKLLNGVISTNVSTRPMITFNSMLMANPLLAGSMIDTQMGLSMGATYDPASGIQVTATSNLVHGPFLLYRMAIRAKSFLAYSNSVSIIQPPPTRRTRITTALFGLRAGVGGEYLFLYPPAGGLHDRYPDGPVPPRRGGPGSPLSA